MVEHDEKRQVGGHFTFSRPLTYYMISSPQCVAIIFHKSCPGKQKSDLHN